MLKKPIRKFLGLFVLYAVFIVGIFVVQFRSDSIIRKNIHGLRVTLSETEGEGGRSLLKNSFQVAFNGLLFSGDDKNPVVYSTSSGREVPARLLSFEESITLSIVTIWQ